MSRTTGCCCRGVCPVMLGALAGLRDHADARPGLLMLDGHEDAFSPAQSPTGEASDSELAIALGLASDRLPAPLDNLVPLLDPATSRSLARETAADIDAAGARFVEGHVALFLSGEETSRADSPAATALRALETPDFWLHIDLDVLATDAFGAADYLQPGGLTWSELDAIAGAAVARLSLQRCERGHLQPRARSRSARGRSGDRVLVPPVGGRMIARTWKGRVRRADAEKYADYIRETGFGEYGQTPGNRGAWMLRHDEGDRTESITLSLWESEDAIRAFAGDDIEAAVLYPEDELYLMTVSRPSRTIRSSTSYEEGGARHGRLPARGRARGLRGGRGDQAAASAEVGARRQRLPPRRLACERRRQWRGCLVRLRAGEAAADQGTARNHHARLLRVRRLRADVRADPAHGAQGEHRRLPALADRHHGPVPRAI